MAENIATLAKSCSELIADISHEGVCGLMEHGDSVVGLIQAMHAAPELAAPLASLVAHLDRAAELHIIVPRGEEPTFASLMVLMQVRGWDTRAGEGREHAGAWGK